MPDGGDEVGPVEPAVVSCVVFVFHDGSAAQSASLRSARKQHRPAALELHIVDSVVDADDFAARNRAIGRAKGSYIAVIDQGADPDAEWLSDSIVALRDDPTLGVVAAGADGPERDPWVVDPRVDAFVARRSMWSAAGGYDDDVGGAAQGLSLGWRCWLLGWRATILEGHTSTTGSVPASRTDLEHLAATFLRTPGSLRMADGQGVAASLRQNGRRRRLQRDRRRPDGEIGGLLTAAIEAGGAAAELGSVMADGGAGRSLGTRRSIVVATADTLAPTMAGPGIRAWQIAKSLAPDHDVHLVTTGACSLTETRFSVEAVDHDRFVELVDAADVVIFQGWVMADRPWLAQSDVVVVADVYDPMHLEQLEHGRDAPVEGGRWTAVAGATDALNQQFRRGDYFLCASDKQRDLWLGHLASVGRVNQITYDEDNGYSERLRIVPFGIEDRDPTAKRHAIREAHPEIGPDDEVILWGGGIYNWFDPLTLIRAVDSLGKRRPSVRLYFLGTRHPNPEILEMQMAVAARALSEELGLTGSRVFFNDGWVPYEERADYLLDADVAVSIHRAHIETEFSFRTRLLDYLWCGLPIVATSGDSFEAIIEDNDLGIVVPPGDVDALEAALERLLADPDWRARIGENSLRVVEDFRWTSALEPIRELCRNPTRSPDVACPETAVEFGVPERPSAWKEDIALARRYVSEGGMRLLVDRVQSRLARRKAENV